MVLRVDPAYSLCMGTDAAEAVETLPYPYAFKVHHSMCTELLKLVYKVSKIFPEIEAARPRCSSGIQALSLLHETLEKAKRHLRCCCESSKLYLVITGDVIVSRYQRSRNLFEQSLGKIQTMVPVILAAEISQLIDDLRAAMFMLESSEEEAGKAMRELIQQSSKSDSVVNSEIKAIQLAASRLHITSRKAILIERRSIKNQLDKVGGNDPRKRSILNYLLLLLKKHEDLIIEEQGETPKSQHEGFFSLKNPNNTSLHQQNNQVESSIGCGQSETRTELFSRATPPEEFKCPISMRIMYDPVVIASGQTFERMWIQKWFDEGNDTCPKNKVKLAHCALTPNISMKDLISKWCVMYGITVPDPCIQASKLLDISVNSIASLGSYMNDLNLPSDISDMSLRSIDASYSSESAQSKSNLMPIQNKDDSYRRHSYINMNQQDLKFLSGLAELPWESQCRMVEDVKSCLQCNDQLFHSLSSENFVEPLFRFLRDAHDQQDRGAQRFGYQLLLSFASKNRSGISYLHEDVFDLLSSFLDSEVIEEVLAIFEVLSGHPYCQSKITASGALVSIRNILDSHSTEFQKQAIKILLNLSSNDDICSQIVSMECVPKLVPLIKNDNLSSYSVALLRNLCDIEEARVSVAETNGCIASIAELLDSGGREEQEHAASILLSLCSQRLHYCQLVMEEGVIPSLVDMSINGTDKGRAIALELLRQLRGMIEYDNEHEGFVSDIDAGRDSSHQTPEKKSDADADADRVASNRTIKKIFKNLSVFPKRSAFASKKKR
ncbi:U BOX DOMAIN-CONTAINING [Salix viminalis]|uniref:RING-type E3 ubiquitin transferase n=1 Tax=Salix viminalis TaxID=40686 RepID=A0A9Q0NZ71_SALVM|nr:U BOX DOMAIN-CONTAINING [Salix viminalis]